MTTLEQDSIKQRFDSLLQTIQIKSTEIDSAKLFGVWKEVLPKLYKELCVAAVTDFTNFTSSENTMFSEPQKFSMISLQNDNLEIIISILDNIINTICKTSAIHEFISYILRDLEIEKKIQYLICIKDSLETLPLMKTWKASFDSPIIFPEIFKFFEKHQEEFYIISIPPTILQEKISWSLIVHEIGHIVIDYYNLVEKIYPEYPVESSHLPEGKNYFHSMEYISDYIANKYSGRVFYDCIYQYGIGKKIRPEGTHPSWEARLHFLQEKISVNENKKITIIPPENHTGIPKLNEIVTRTDTLTFDKIASVYVKNTDELKNIIKTLEEKIPYTDSPIYLLNAFNENRDNIITTLLKNDKTKKETRTTLISKIEELIEDSIRISNMKRSFKIMVD